MNLNELAPKKTQRLNRIMESRFGFAIDYDNLTYPKAQRLSIALGESLDRIRKSYGAHTAEKNPKYMEMFMVREGLTAWLDQHETLLEGELETAEAVLAAKDMVDSVQDMITDASKMMNEELPPLLDTIRDQIGTAQADSYKQTVTAALQTLMDSLNAARDALDSGARVLAGEQPDQSMNMGSELQPPEVPIGDVSSELDSDDGFAATDAAAGGDEELGRERR
jgi:paraquat-inducible protein B